MSLFRRLILSLMGLTLMATAGPAAPLPADVPLPIPRPELDAEGRIVVVPSLEAGLDQLANGDLAGARVVRDKLESDPLGRDILRWAIARSSDPDVTSAEIRGARRALAGWPGMGRLDDNYERALYRETPPADDILAAFAKQGPQTARGEILLIRALAGTGKTGEAARRARKIWRNRLLDDTETAVFLSEFGQYLGRADHLHRMQMLLYRDRASAALAPARKADALSLHRAWAAVIRDPAGAEAALAKVDEKFRSGPAFRYLKIRHYREIENNAEAARLLAEMPADIEDLVDPGEWWVERRIVSRGLYEAGEAESAYRIAAAHHASEPPDIAEAEFHAGWYALRGLLDPEKATPHFRKLIAVARKPANKARGWYWLARATEASDGAAAARYYESAAAYPAAFYGQLAAAALARDGLDLPAPEPDAADRKRFAGRPVVAAIERLEQAGATSHADILYRALAEEIESPGELALLVERAENRGDHRLTLQIGKIAFRRGLDVAALAFPLGALPEAAIAAGPGLALAYSVARQESAFDVAAVSPADARGLLQLLPGTARGVAARHGLAYAPARLTTDAGYNVTLGSHYLGEQIDAFGGSYILTFIAYNAGPRRVREWIARFGDPRGKPLDEVIDWVELIPFSETRDYVQKVIENYEIYKTRLGQTADIENDLRFGRR